MNMQIPFLIRVAGRIWPALADKLLWLWIARQLPSLADAVFEKPRKRKRKSRRHSPLTLAQEAAIRLWFEQLHSGRTLPSEDTELDELADPPRVWIAPRGGAPGSRMPLPLQQW